MSFKNKFGSLVPFVSLRPKNKGLVSKISVRAWGINNLTNVLQTSGFILPISSNLKGVEAKQMMCLCFASGGQSIQLLLDALRTCLLEESGFLY